MIEDIPEVHVIVIPHNHYDHLDNCTVSTLFKHAHTLDWWGAQRVEIPATSFKLTCTPAQHWSSMAVEGKGKKFMSRYQKPSRVFCCFITALLFTIVVPTVWITSALWIGSTGVLDNFHETESRNRSLVLFVKPLTANIASFTAVAGWSVESDTCRSDCTEVEIFFDIDPPPLNESDPGYRSYHDKARTTPIFTWNATGTGNTRNFRSKLNLLHSDDVQDYKSGHFDKHSPAYYPFDRYETSISAFARDASTNESIQLEFHPGSGFVVGLQFAIVGGPSEDANQISHIGLSLKRNTLIIVYCLVITIAFWLITLMICLIMIATVVFGFRQRNEIVVVPIGTVFTFTQLRESMPGAPKTFGDIIDLVGLLPCLILLSISAVAMVGIYLFADPDNPSRRTLSWDELENDLLHYSNRIATTSKQYVRRARFRVLKATRRRAPYNDVEIPLVDDASENPV
ncbi:hypothetical protein IW261DRAFT_1632015 [Armillaria novae-zelandiae]|uniref:Metallo-beta-lactamase domain-containing protein n=1 Tax=Armillaria novae-zelandiae TaxID=153914 RepID=A0AA39P599_9AGAR|nr:hypothetical protein IW261DRAFT_1632015 [Armillaria novae-zelandiae]